jgi:hypothetical protein
MMFMSITIFYALTTLTQLSLAQQNSELFSLYLGASAATATFDGLSADLQSSYLKICTNYVHALPNPTAAAIHTSMYAQFEQEQVDGLCQLCTSLSQSKVDSCCSVATSVDCFFAGQKAPATNKATSTGSSSTATATTKSSSGNKVDVVSRNPIKS